MTVTHDPALSLQDMPRLASKYKRLLTAGPLIGLVVFVAASFLLPNKYKVTVLLSIDPRYFESPMVGEFTPGFGGAGEMKTQGESLLRQSLTPEFMDSLGQKYTIYWFLKPASAAISPLQRWRTDLKNILMYYGLMHPALNASYELAEERQNLITHVEIFNEYGTTYRIGFIDSNPDTAFHVTQDLYGQIIHSLLDWRTRNLVNIRDAISRRLDSLTGHLDTPAAPAHALSASSNPDLLREQLNQVRDQLRVARSQFTDAHPLIQELRKKENDLTAQVRMSQGNTLAAPGRPEAESAASREVYNDLTRKLNYLKIAIDSDQDRQADYFTVLEPPLYPASPLWPKKPLFAVWGLSFGLFVSLFSAAILEYFDRSALRAETLAQHLDLPLLGSLPAFSWKASQRTILLETPSKKPAGQRQTPQP